MKWPDFLKFASDATIAGLVGGALLLVSLWALWGEKRRKARIDIDRVGIMPWRDIAALSLFAGLILMVFAITGWLKG